MIRTLICVTLLSLAIPIGSTLSQQDLAEHIEIRWCPYDLDPPKGRLEIKRQVKMGDRDIGTAQSQWFTIPPPTETPTGQ